MSHKTESAIAYFISITRCKRDKAIEQLEKVDWQLDKALNSYFEFNSNSEQTDHNTSSINSPSQTYENKPHIRTFDTLTVSPISSPRTIIIPAMIEFQRFIESFHLYSNILLENSSKMMNLAIKYSTNKQTNISSNDIEHLKIHLKVDYTRLQALLDNDMCAPTVWIEHFEHLLDGNCSQLFDCDYMFRINHDVS